MKPSDTNRTRGQMRRTLFICVWLITFAGCNASDARNINNAGNSNVATNAPNITRSVKPQADAEAAVIETSYGRIVIELYPNVAPQMVERFKTLIRSGFYDGQTFHRVSTEYGIVQAGDPLSRDNDPENDGSGNSDSPDLKAEFSDLPYERGTVGAARGAGDDSANSQFFITLKRQPDFDERYTIFGRVIEGINNADVIMGAPVVEGAERPAEPIKIKQISLQPRASFAK